MDHTAALLEQGRLLGELYSAADPTTAIPTCPGWTLRQLVTHVGRGHRWAAATVREASDSPVDIRTVPDGRLPDDAADAVTWLDGSAAALVDAVATTGADTPVWTFLGPRPAGWWIRRRLHEATVHRADAALALDVPYDLAAGIAADGVSEYLDLVAARPAGAGPVPLDIGQSLHLHATDDGLGGSGEWLVHGDGVAVSWEHGHGKGAVAVRGRASDLLLAVLRRLPADDGRLELLGETAVWRAWLERTAF